MYMNLQRLLRIIAVTKYLTKNVNAHGSLKSSFAFINCPHGVYGAEATARHVLIDLVAECCRGFANGSPHAEGPGIDRGPLIKSYVRHSFGLSVSCCGRNT